MSATAVAEAEGLSLYPSSDDEESAVLADLVAMFPALDHDVILTVLQSHHGSLEAAVDYLMTASSLSESDQNQLNSTGTMYPVYDMEGQYSEDIGGLPEVVPTFELDEGVEEEDSETDEESTSRDSSPTPDTRVSLEDDPLPTYEEACMGTDVLPMPRYIVDDQPVESIETHIPSANGGGGGEHQQEECLATAVQPDDGAQKHRVRKGKRKKLKKLANKLSLRKEKASDHKTERKRFGSGVPVPSSYQRLVDGIDVEDLYELKDETEEDSS